MKVNSKSLSIGNDHSNLSDFQATYHDALAIANHAPDLVCPDHIKECINQSNGIDWKRCARLSLSFYGAASLGTLTILTIVGLLTTPLGWAIAGAALWIGLMGSIASGKGEIFKKALFLSYGGFLYGIGLGVIVKASAKAQSV